MRGWRAVSSGVVVLAVLGTACGRSGAGSGSAAAPGALGVVASFSPLAVAAEQVGGDRVRVTNLTPTGAEPHDLELDPRQTKELLEAGVAVVMGRGFQPAVEHTAGQRQGVTVEVLRALPVSQAGEVAPEGQAAGLDPHVWLDPVLMADVVDRVAAALARAAPADADGFRVRAREYRSQLEVLHRDYEQGLGTCKRREIVTAHEAFGWLATRYGLRQLGIAGLSPEAEPDPRRLAELAALVRRDGVTTIFTEALVSPAVAQALAREAGVRTVVLNPLEGLTEEEIARGATYVSVMRDNLAVLREALACS
ncbi:MAG: metal ABC transporter substrate-binding protein [Egibacteraceae bacterium]